MDEVTASAHPRTWEPTWDLGKEDLDWGCRRSAGGPRGLCSAGPPYCSSGLHVLGSVARALLWDRPVPAIGQGQAPGMWARGGGAAPGGSGHCRRPSSWREATCGARRKGDLGWGDGGPPGGVQQRHLVGDPGMRGRDLLDPVAVRSSSVCCYARCSMVSVNVFL